MELLISKLWIYRFKEHIDFVIDQQYFGETVVEIDDKIYKIYNYYDSTIVVLNEYNIGYECICYYCLGNSNTKLNNKIFESSHYNTKNIQLPYKLLPYCTGFYTYLLENDLLKRLCHILLEIYNDYGDNLFNFENISLRNKIHFHVINSKNINLSNFLQNAKLIKDSMNRKIEIVPVLLTGNTFTNYNSILQTFDIGNNRLRHIVCNLICPNYRCAIKNYINQLIIHIEYNKGKCYDIKTEYSFLGIGDVFHKYKIFQQMIIQLLTPRNFRIFSNIINDLYELFFSWHYRIFLENIENFQIFFKDILKIWKEITKFNNERLIQYSNYDYLSNFEFINDNYFNNLVGTHIDSLKRTINSSNDILQLFNIINIPKFNDYHKEIDVIDDVLETEKIIKEGITSLQDFKTQIIKFVTNIIIKYFNKLFPEKIFTNQFILPMQKLLYYDFS